MQILATWVARQDRPSWSRLRNRGLPLALIGGCDEAAHAAIAMSYYADHGERDFHTLLPRTGLALG
jgi:hypothetical protein